MDHHHGHSYVSDAISATVALGNPQPQTFILGLAHGVIWIAMSLVCIAAARAHVIPFWLAVTVAVWWLIGDRYASLSESASYVIRPFPVSPAAERAAGRAVAFAASREILSVPTVSHASQ